MVGLKTLTIQIVLFQPNIFFFLSNNWNRPTHKLLIKKELLTDWMHIYVNQYILVVIFSFLLLYPSAGTQIHFHDYITIFLVML